MPEYIDREENGLKLQPFEYWFPKDGNWEIDRFCSRCVPNSFGTLNCVKVVELPRSMSKGASLFEGGCKDEYLYYTQPFFAKSSDQLADIFGSNAGEKMGGER